MDKQPQPVPPIFQPEVAAEAVFWSAHHRRRELWVGFPAVKAILGTRIIPGLLDRMLASKAYSGQHTDQPLPKGRKDNLYEPVPGDHGAHGRFDDHAKSSSWQYWLTTHRWVMVAMSLLVLVLLGVGLSLIVS